MARGRKPRVKIQLHKGSKWRVQGRRRNSGGIEEWHRVRPKSLIYSSGDKMGT
jgi:hypothetical protein